MTTKNEQLNFFAGLAMQALISKLPLLDREGEFGDGSKDIANVKSDLAQSAWEYAQYMVKHWDKAHDWVTANYEVI